MDSKMITYPPASKGDEGRKPFKSIVQRWLAPADGRAERRSARGSGQRGVGERERARGSGQEKRAALNTTSPRQVSARIIRLLAKVSAMTAKIEETRLNPSTEAAIPRRDWAADSLWAAAWGREQRAKYESARVCQQPA